MIIKKKKMNLVNEIQLYIIPLIADATPSIKTFHKLIRNIHLNEYIIVQCLINFTRIFLKTRIGDNIFIIF